MHSGNTLNQGLNINLFGRSPCSGKTEGTASFKTIYIEFEDDLTTAKEAAIKNMELGHGESLVVTCRPAVYNVDNYEGNGVFNARYDVTIIMFVHLQIAV